jgi:hypothetical protein
MNNPDHISQKPFVWVKIRKFLGADPESGISFPVMYNKKQKGLGSWQCGGIFLGHWRSMFVNFVNLTCISVSA